MKKGIFVLVAGLVGLTGFHQHSEAQDGRPVCPPGCKIIEEVVMKEHVRFCCRVVPLIRKKWVYDWVPDGFCVGHNPHCGSGLGLGCKDAHCQHCQGHDCDPRCRKLLVKRLVEECIGQKCDVERIVELVPCTIYRVVPCGTPGLEPIPAPKIVVPDKK